MKARITVLIAGRNAQELQELEDMLGDQPGLALSKRLITNGHSDPLYNVCLLYTSDAADTPYV